MSRPTAPFLVCANWKMNLAPSEGGDWAARFRAEIEGDLAVALASPSTRLHVAVAPAHVGLDRVGAALEGACIQLAAQNVHQEAEGAFTGEVSVDMLTDLGCRYALIGHSERRQIFGESDDLVAAKAIRLSQSTIVPILCIGETLEERERGQTLAVVDRQLRAVIDHPKFRAQTDSGSLSAGDGLGGGLVVAYEPVWAIGTGKTATPEMAQEVHAAIRSTLCEVFGPDAGSKISLLYGGSVKPSNARELLSQPDINGALVGGASLDPEAFAGIAKNALACLETI